MTMKKTYCKEKYSFDTISEIIVAICSGKKVTTTESDEHEYNIYREYEVFIYNNHIVTYYLDINLERIPADIFNLTSATWHKYFHENENWYNGLNEFVKDDISSLRHILEHANITIENGIQIVDKYDIEKRKRNVDEYIEEYERIKKKIEEYEK